MGTSTRAHRARDAAGSVGSNPYVRRLIEDEELRDSIRDAYEAGRSAYGRLSHNKAPGRALMDDKKVHHELRDAAQSLREASDRLRGRTERKRSFGKVLFVGLVAAGVALVVSDDLRKAVLDRLFGAEEEFEYTSTTAPTNGAPVGA